MHTRQGNLFDTPSAPEPSGVALREIGTAMALGGLPQGMAAVIQHAIHETAERLASFTSEDVMESLPAEVRQTLRLHPNAIGGCMVSAAKADYIEALERPVRAKHANARGRKITAWRRKFATDDARHALGGDI